MEKVMIFNEREKRRLLALCVLPCVLLVVAVVYYIISVRPAMNAKDAGTLMSYTLMHYNTMLVFMGIYATAAAAVLIYFLVLLARVKNLNSAQKVMWLFVLCAFVPVSFLVFWYFVLHREPTVVPIYPSID